MSVGRKPVMNHVVACMTFFNSGSKKVVVKARGRAISKAVDTVELLRCVFVKDLKLQGISVGTEQVTRVEGQKSNVLAIEITVTKPSVLSMYPPGTIWNYELDYFRS